MKRLQEGDSCPNTGLANLHLTLLDRVGIHLDSFVDSTGKVEDLFERIDVG